MEENNCQSEPGLVKLISDSKSQRFKLFDEAVRLYFEFVSYYIRIVFVQCNLDTFFLAHYTFVFVTLVFFLL